MTETCVLLIIMNFILALPLYLTHRKRNLPFNSRRLILEAKRSAMYAPSAIHAWLYQVLLLKLTVLLHLEMNITGPDNITAYEGALSTDNCNKNFR